MCASSPIGGIPRAPRCASFCAPNRERPPRRSKLPNVPPIARPMDELTRAAITPEPPIASRRDSKRTLHGVTLSDDYAWLKDANWQEVLRKPELLAADIRAYLEAENRYTESLLGPTKTLQETL